GAAARPRPPGPRQAVCRDGPVGAGTCGAVHSYRDVPGHGDDLLAPGDGGSTGADGSTMIMGSATRPHRETLRPILAQVFAQSSDLLMCTQGTSEGLGCS